MANTDEGAIEFGEHLRKLRRASGLSQEEIAHRANLSFRSVSDIERGISASPRRDTVAQLADGLGLTGADRDRFFELLPRRVHRRRTPSISHTGDSVPPMANAPGQLPAQSRLPETAGTLIGRERELAAAVVALSGSSRILTITGPPGVGKTRFAIELARQPANRERFEATAFVSLASARTSVEALGLIMTTLGISVTALPLPVAVVREFLAHHRVLLVLDNLEQLDGAGRLLAEIDSDRSRTRIITTSRHRLSLRRGNEITLAPLALPATDLARPSRLSELRLVPSMRLLLDRLQWAGRSLDLTATNAPDLIAICRAIDGLPLALEIASARLRSMAPGQLLAQLHERKSLPLPGPEDAPDRQRSLRSAVAWSVDLLTEDVRRVLARVAVFSDGFVADAALAVAWPTTDPESLDPGRVPEILGELVDKHLLVLEHAQPDTDPLDNSASRYRMLQTIREYGLESLVAGGDERETRDAHARWCDELVEIVERGLHGDHPDRWLRRLDQELANIRSAIDWSAARAVAGDEASVERSLRLAARLWQYWRVRGLSDEGIRRIEAALVVDAERNGPAPSLDRARAQNNLGILVMDTGDSLRTRALYETSLAMSRAIGDGRGIADTVNNLGVLAVYHGNYVDAQRYHEEAYWLRLSLGDPQRLLFSLQNLGDVALDLDLHDLTIAFHAGGLQIARRVGDRSSVAYGYLAMGELLTDLGHFGRARRYLADALVVFEAIGDQLGLGFLAHTWGWLSAREGNHRTALVWQQRALNHWRQSSNRRGQVNAIEAAALALGQLGRHAMATTLLLGAKRVRAEEHIGRPPKRTPLVERAMAAIGRETPLAAVRQPSDVSLEELVSLALRQDTVVRRQHVPRRGPIPPARTGIRAVRRQPSSSHRW